MRSKMQIVVRRGYSARGCLRSCGWNSVRKAEVWRVAFAFDPNRQAMLLAASDKGGADQKRSYKRLIGLADTRFDRHLAALAVAAAQKEKRQAKKS